MLGALLLGAAELTFIFRVLALVAPARSGASDRMHDDATVLHPDERLGRRADEGRAGEVVDQEHVRRRVHVPQRAVEGERLGRGRHVEPLRDDDLYAVALGDELARTSDARSVLVGGPVRGDRSRAAIGPRQDDRLVERREDTIDAFGGRRRLTDDVVGEHQEGMPDMIETHDRVVDRERGLGESEHFAWRRWKALESARRLVRDEPDGAAREPREIGAARAPIAGELRAEKGKRIVVGEAPFAAVLDDRRDPAPKRNGGARHHADERVASHALSAFDALEEEGAAQRAQLRERRHRGLEIGEALAHDRHQLARHGAPRRHRHCGLQTKTLVLFRDEGSWCHPISARHRWRTLSLRYHGVPR